MKEITDKELSVVDMLTESVVELSYAVQTQNAIILVLLHNSDLKLPEWKSLEDVQNDVGAKVEKCTELIRSLHGHDQTNQS